MSLKKYFYYYFNPDEDAEPQGDVEYSGSVVSFVTKRASSVTSLLVDVIPAQSGSGDPSPTNIRPITGWTGANIHVSPTQDAQDGTTYAVDWTADAGTVYGGVLDVLTGVLTVTAVGKEFDGTESWSLMFSTTNPLFRHTISGVKASTSGAARACSHFPNASITSQTTEQGYYAYSMSSQTSVYMQFRPDMSVYDTAATWKAFLAEQYAAGTPVTAWAELTEGYYQTYQLTAQEVSLLLGQNYIWTDAGDVTVTVPAKDVRATKSQIRSLQAESEQKRQASLTKSLWAGDEKVFNDLEDDEETKRSVDDEEPAEDQRETKKPIDDVAEEPNDA